MVDTSALAEDFPSQIRVSIGSAIILKLETGKLEADSQTAYLMTYHEGKCAANCVFCPQAKNSQSKAEQLSRVTWPAYPASIVLKHLQMAVEEGKIWRICIQALNYPQMFQELSAFVHALKQSVTVQVSVSCQPLKSENLWALQKAGVDRVGVAIDAANERLFNMVKGAGADGPYRWRQEFLLMRVALGIFGEGNVSTHIIIGLGETEHEAIHLVQECVDMGVLPALFAFTPVKGTKLEANLPPNIEAYRRVQLASFLVVNGLARANDMLFDDDGHVVDFGVEKPKLMEVVESGEPFETSGCPGCNRPFYNEKPSGPLYNFPRKLSAKEIAQIKSQLKIK